MGGAMLSKSLIQFSVEGQGCVPSFLFDLRPNYGGGNEDNGDLLQNVPCALLHSVPSTLQQATTDPCLCQRLLDTHRQVWVSLVNLITWTTALSNSMKLRHAVWGHPRRVGHGGEV